MIGEIVESPEGEDLEAVEWSNKNFSLSFCSCSIYT